LKGLRISHGFTPDLPVRTLHFWDMPGYLIRLGYLCGQAAAMPKYTADLAVIDKAVEIAAQ